MFAGTPMLCKTTQRTSLDTGNWSGYVFEPKHDGMRALVVVTEEGVRVYGRSGLEYTEHLPHFEELASLPIGTILDGELAIIKSFVEVSDEFVPVTDFNKTMRVMGSLASRARELQLQNTWVVFVVYDLLSVGENEISGTAWHHRRALLGELMEKYNFASAVLNPVFRVSSQEAGVIYDQLVEFGIEGMIAKNETSPYVFNGRPNKTWYKLKVATTADVVVMDYEEGRGKHKGRLGAMIFGAHQDGKLVRVGKAGGGFSDIERQDIWDNQEKYLGRVCEVKFNDTVGSGVFKSPRHPQFITFRTDKLPEECSRDQFRAENV